jgi:hypothetical protein
MKTLTPRGKSLVEDLAKRFHLGTASALHMLLAVHRGGGTMAQFNCLEFGSGQWMRGGMTMVGDMFDHALKAKVNALCSELSAALAEGGLFESLPEDRAPSGNWWPLELGAPTASGGQNQLLYGNVTRHPQFRRGRKALQAGAGRAGSRILGNHRPAR